MHLILHRPHPDRPCAAVTNIAVEITHPRADLIMLSYVVVGAISGILLTAVTPSFRNDGLWRHLFRGLYRDGGGPRLLRIQLHRRRSGLYRFADYRQGMTVAEETGMPAITVQTNPHRYQLQGGVFTRPSVGTAARVQWRLSLSAVIAERNRRLSYWALAHPPGKPDFHHPDGFTHPCHRDLLSCPSWSGSKTGRTPLRQQKVASR